MFFNSEELEERDKLLDELKNIPYMESFLIVDKVGSILFEFSSKKINSDNIAGIGATLFGASETLFTEFGKKDVSKIIINGDEGIIIALEINSNNFIMVVLQKEADFDNTLKEMNSFILSFRKFLK
jgi:predicted regulator of Ras-like GTPase activity (Roadblock/LC7/MglB family)